MMAQTDSVGLEELASNLHIGVVSLLVQKSHHRKSQDAPTHPSRRNVKRLILQQEGTKLGGTLMTTPDGHHSEHTTRRAVLSEPSEHLRRCVGMRWDEGRTNKQMTEWSSFPSFLSALHRFLQERADFFELLRTHC
ncbi:unnamed protein product [Ectocarpus sp. 12 AP-2014]